MSYLLVDGSAAVQGLPMDPEQDLVARIRASDADAFEMLYAEFAPGLLRFAFAQLRSRELAEEAVQDLFLKLWKHRHKWVLTHSLRSYLFRAMRNCITNYRRTTAARHELQQSLGDDDDTLSAFPSPECADDHLSEADLLRALDHAVATLPKRCRETFVLVRQQQLSYADAAEVLGVSVKAVEMNMVRAFAALRQQLADWRSSPCRRPK